jgi:hypothetical protein
MDTVFDKVAGLDVHHKFITVGIRCRLETGKLFADGHKKGDIKGGHSAFTSRARKGGHKRGT